MIMLTKLVKVCMNELKSINIVLGIMTVSTLRKLIIINQVRVSYDSAKISYFKQNLKKRLIAKVLLIRDK